MAEEQSSGGDQQKKRNASEGFSKVRRMELSVFPSWMVELRVRLTLGAPGMFQDLPGTECPTRPGVADTDTVEGQR